MPRFRRYYPRSRGWRSARRQAGRAASNGLRKGKRQGIVIGAVVGLIFAATATGAVIVNKIGTQIKKTGLIK